jgi:hypothetical protein
MTAPASRSRGTQTPTTAGYGPWLADRLAQSWGVNTGNGHDKTVWFTLLLSPGPPPARERHG